MKIAELIVDDLGTGRRLGRWLNVHSIPTN
jgi:hypothetical protein